MSSSIIGARIGAIQLAGSIHGSVDPHRPTKLHLKILEINAEPVLQIAMDEATVTETGVNHQKCSVLIHLHQLDNIGTASGRVFDDDGVVVDALKTLWEKRLHFPKSIQQNRSHRKALRYLELSLDGIPDDVKWDDETAELEYERNEMMQGWKVKDGSVDCILLYESQADDKAVKQFLGKCEKIQKDIDARLEAAVESDERQAALKEKEGETRRDSAAPTPIPHTVPGNEEDAEPLEGTIDRQNGRTMENALRAMRGELSRMKLAVQAVKVKVSPEEYKNMVDPGKGMAKMLKEVQLHCSKETS